MAIFQVENYTYDSNRLLFYPVEYDVATVERICANIKANDSYATLYKTLNAYNADEIHIKPGTLQKAGICLTDNCNFRCNYCCASSIDGNTDLLTVENVITFATDVMKRWAVNRLLGRADESLNFYFTGGGEQTYNWELFANSVIQIRQKGLDNNIPITLSITTNGVLDNVQRRFLADNFDSIMVSYDGMPEIQNKNRRCMNIAFSSDAVEETIKYFISNTSASVIIRTTLWQSDVSRLKKMADYIFTNFGNSAGWSILPVIPTGRALNRVAKEHKELSEFDFLSFYVDMAEYAKTKFGQVRIIL